MHRLTSLIKEDRRHDQERHPDDEPGVAPCRALVVLALQVHVWV